MTIDARVLRNAPISRFNSDRLMKILKRERERMEKPVVGLSDPMTDEVVGQMAIVAGSDVSMAGLLPGVIMPLHDVAIRARFWIAAQVAGAFAIAECKQAYAEQQAEQYGQCGRKKRHATKGSTAPVVAATCCGGNVVMWLVHIIHSGMNSRKRSDIVKLTNGMQIDNGLAGCDVSWRDEHSGWSFHAPHTK
jgi:hypothetical protein